MTGPQTTLFMGFETQGRKLHGARFLQGSGSRQKQLTAVSSILRMRGELQYDGTIFRGNVALALRV